VMYGHGCSCYWTTGRAIGGMNLGCRQSSSRSLWRVHIIVGSFDSIYGLIVRASWKISSRLILMVQRQLVEEYVAVSVWSQTGHNQSCITSFLWFFNLKYCMTMTSGHMWPVQIAVWSSLVSGHVDWTSMHYIWHIEDFLINDHYKDPYNI
jgi:hypothetical protein